MEKLRKKEKKDLYKKLTAHISKKLRYMIEVEDWTQVEISIQTKVPQNRLCEIINYENYGHLALSEHNLLFLIQGGIVTTTELKENCSLNQKEGDYLDETFLIHEDEKMKKVYVKCIKAGLNPAEILEKALVKDS